ncbi:hypothetical protein FVEG_15516 [Fusarium verticillioides 7600]|uniref:Uncharacterized protein n=1 Tax=Gibberella moniliformis (strain M3125 / FGSC 7600) TaxID=334819 RepID=W7M662_GIBM7|nr:hypothetical protein FVEG_15516 [Fusarium verticillioides 7600]EWG42954.1 hypothetical protein FVEG_15516 [Fusarium verticillioides 7600]
MACLKSWGSQARVFWHDRHMSDGTGSASRGITSLILIARITKGLWRCEFEMWVIESFTHQHVQ